MKDKKQGGEAGGRELLGKVVVVARIFNRHASSVSTNFSSSGKKGRKRVARNEKKKREGGGAERGIVTERRRTAVRTQACINVGTKIIIFK